MTKKQIVTKINTQHVMKPKLWQKSNCYKAQIATTQIWQFKLWQLSLWQNSNCDETQNIFGKYNLATRQIDQIYSGQALAILVDFLLLFFYCCVLLSKLYLFIFTLPNQLNLFNLSLILNSCYQTYTFFSCHASLSSNSEVLQILTYMFLNF